MKTLRLETTAPFQGLAELVAYDEGLFEKEGIQIEWMDREKGLDKSPQLHIDLSSLFSGRATWREFIHLVKDVRYFSRSLEYLTRVRPGQWRVLNELGGHPEI